MFCAEPQKEMAKFSRVQHRGSYRHSRNGHEYVAATRVGTAPILFSKSDFRQVSANENNATPVSHRLAHKIGNSSSVENYYIYNYCTFKDF
jgi:hypothetical protein